MPRKSFLPPALGILLACAGTTVLLLSIQPASALVAPGGSIQLVALNATAPTWAVSETGGGTVTSAGLYTAPSCPTTGVFHVVVASGGKTASAEITVADPIAGVTVTPSTVVLAPGESAQFTAHVTSGCGVVTASTVNLTRAKK